MLILASLSLLAWLYLALFHGRFWESAPVLPAAFDPQPSTVAVVIPARDEADSIETTVRSLFAQQLPTGTHLHLFVVDDNSTDATGAILARLATEDPRLTTLTGQPLHPGWTGKLWAVHQGLEAAHPLAPDFILLTDADIIHAPGHLAQLLHFAQQNQLDLTSEMVRLRCESFAERATVPAFVFFFAMLYPFHRAADPRSPVAAAAGGTMLLRASALQRIGGVQRIRHELIDDCALAREIKRGDPPQRHPIWLGHANLATSGRRYPHLRDVYGMVARTAYVQLRHSPLLLLATTLGMLLLYIAPVTLTLAAHGPTRQLALTTWFLMALLFQPTLLRYRRSPLWGLALPAIGLFYLAATLGSALRHYRGQGGQWKNRTYPAT